MKIGIIREGKIPPDNRVPLTPAQCREAMDKFSVEILVETSHNRCYSDREYRQAGIKLVESVDDCDVLLGVKEVPIDKLVAGKTYLFFSHTIKEQAYNRALLQAILDKAIRLIDYEVLTDAQGHRVIAFGRFAGMVGAHNAIWTYGKRSNLFLLPRMKDLKDYREAKSVYAQLQLPPVKVVLTGTGRVGHGAAQVLTDMGLEQVAPQDYLTETYDHPVFTQLKSEDYIVHKVHRDKFEASDFYKNPSEYESRFAPFYRESDIMINGIFWNNEAPAFFTRADMCRDDFKIEVIADITCDIAPVSSIPSTLRATTIPEPVFGYHAEEDLETSPFLPFTVDMMAIDNLPNELPRDASESFGKQFLDFVMAELLKGDDSEMIEKATIAKDGRLGKYFQYLEGFVKGDEALTGQP